MRIASRESVAFETSPFLKWAGGKRWLISNHNELLPTTYKKYYEPFLGGGAVFFCMKPKKSVLADINPDLIETYQAIKDDWRSIADLIEKYHRAHSVEFYYKIRSQNFEDPVERAARFIYLNRTCWNGLYRVNLKGVFNVPIGTKTNVVLNTDSFEGVSNALKNTKLKVGDFEEIIQLTKADDFLFVDPPYTVKHNFNGFIKYNNTLFSWDDQIRLRDCIQDAVSRGVKVLLTNADHPSVRELYEGIGEMLSLDRLSVISGNAGGRGRFSELIIKCY